MQPQSKAGIAITDFMGLYTNNGRIATSEDVMFSSAQINLVSESTAQMTVRPGIRPVSFDEDSED